MGVLQNFQKFRVLLWHGRTELTEVPSTGMNVLQNQQKFGYGYESLTELTEVSGIVTRAYRT